MQFNWEIVNTLLAEYTRVVIILFYYTRMFHPLSEIPSRLIQWVCISDFTIALGWDNDWVMTKPEHILQYMELKVFILKLDITLTDPLLTCLQVTWDKFWKKNKSISEFLNWLCSVLEQSQSISPPLFGINYCQQRCHWVPLTTQFTIRIFPVHNAWLHDK